MAKKGVMPNFSTIDEYIRHQPDEAQKLLLELRACIHEAVPHVEEVLNYKVPSFILVPGNKSKQQLMIAAYEKFVSFYPFPSTLEAFSSELTAFKKGKGSVQFPLSKPFPKDLVIRMVQYRAQELEE